LPVRFVEERDEALALTPGGAGPPDGSVGAGDAAEPVLLAEGPLVDEEAGHDAARAVLGAARLRAVELLQRSRDAGLARSVRPALSRNGEAGWRGVHDLAGGEHRVGVDDLQAVREIGRDHGQE